MSSSWGLASVARPHASFGRERGVFRNKEQSSSTIWGAVDPSFASAPITDNLATDDLAVLVDSKSVENKTSSHLPPARRQNFRGCVNQSAHGPG